MEYLYVAGGLSVVLLVVVVLLVFRKPSALVAPPEKVEDAAGEMTKEATDEPEIGGKEPGLTKKVAKKRIKTSAKSSGKSGRRGSKTAKRKRK